MRSVVSGNSDLTGNPRSHPNPGKQIHRWSFLGEEIQPKCGSLWANQIPWETRSAEIHISLKLIWHKSSRDSELSHTNTSHKTFTVPDPTSLDPREGDENKRYRYIWTQNQSWRRTVRAEWFISGLENPSYFSNFSHPNSMWPHKITYTRRWSASRIASHRPEVRSITESKHVIWLRTDYWGT